MVMLHRLPAILSFAFLVPLAACPDEPEPTSVELVAIDCGRAACESRAPVAMGATMTVQPAELGIVTSIVARNPAVAAIALEPGTTDETWIVTGLRGGTTELELRDARGRVVGTYPMAVAALDHFEGTTKWFLGGRTFAGEHLRSDEPHYFGQPGKLRVIVDPYAGATALRGALTYQIELSLPAASVALENDPSGNVFLELARGENLVTFRAGGHVETFQFVVLTGD